MTVLPAEWLNGEVAIVGMGRSGRSAARLLLREGARVYASDAGDSPEIREAASLLSEMGAQTAAGGHDLVRIGRASLVIASPGVSPEAAPLAAAVAAGAPVLSEVELALRFLTGVRFLVVTGTNGKTTTTALSGHLLRALGYQAVDAGNIGTPLCDVALAVEKPSWVALELSSFQLHDTPGIKPTIGVLTNLSPDHLDRYASIADYYADKALMFRNASSDSRWVVNGDDEESLRMVDGVAGSLGRFSVSKRDVEAWYDRDSEELVVLGRRLLPRSELQLLGDHNVANALAASLAVVSAAAMHESHEMRARLANGLRSFRALRHRLEPIAELANVLWINDSKATNVASALMAVRAMTRPTVLLMGGKHKGESYRSLAADIAKGCRLVIAYGAAAPIIEKDLADSVDVRVSGSNFEEVIELARASAMPGDCVLLAPACSSFDMFANYEERGTRFRELVGAAGSKS